MNLSRSKAQTGGIETIAQRKARLAYDRENPWTPVSHAVIDGTVCELQFSDLVGNFNGGDRRFVLVVNPRWNLKEWHCVDGSDMPWGRPSAFRPTGRILSKTEMARVVRRLRW